MSTYYSGWQDKPYTCAACGWRGLGKDLKHGESFNELFEVDCPSCSGRMGVISYPTIEESKANWDRVSAADKIAVQIVEARRERFEREKLRRAEDLPDLDGDRLELIWDQSEDNDTVVRLRDRVLWREPAFFEGYKRYLEVVDMLSAKYGPRLVAVEPTKVSELWLYGDATASLHMVRECQERLKAGRGACSAADGNSLSAGD